MDAFVIVGWDDIEAFNTLRALCVVPDQNPITVGKPGDEFDPMEFCVSDAGIRYIQNELDIINQRFGTRLEWRVYPGENFVLVWRDELQRQVGDPNDLPVGKFYIDHHLGPNWNETADKFGLTEPVVIVILDSTEYYNKYVYSDDQDHDDSQDDSFG